LGSRGLNIALRPRDVFGSTVEEGYKNTCFRKHAPSPGSLARLLKASTSPKHRGYMQKIQTGKPPQVANQLLQEGKQRERKKENM